MGLQPGHVVLWQLSVCASHPLGPAVAPTPSPKSNNLKLCLTCLVSVLLSRSSSRRSLMEKTSDVPQPLPHCNLVHLGLPLTTDTAGTRQVRPPQTSLLH